jgi:hypothetical protein
MSETPRAEPSQITGQLKVSGQRRPRLRKADHPERPRRALLCESPFSPSDLSSMAGPARRTLSLERPIGALELVERMRNAQLNFVLIPADDRVRPA